MKGAAVSRQRLGASVIALALVASAFAVALTPAGADTPSYSGTEWVFFPWVPNGETLDGTGPWHATVTIQNLEDETINVNTHSVAGGSGSFSTTISARASKTLPASQLGVGSPGGPLAISAEFRTPQYHIDDELEIPIPPKIGAVMKQVSPNPSPSGAGTNDSHISVDGHTAIPAQDIAWGPESTFCHDVGGEDTENCNNVGAYTFGVPEGGFDGHSYLPIVQTNDGWNSVIHVSNIDSSSPSAAGVTLKFYSTDQQGVFSSEHHGAEFTEYLDPGETLTFDLKERGFPENWVGSAWIVSDYSMAASVNRVKPETDMVITNTAAPSVEAITALDGFTQSDGPGDPPAFNVPGDWDTPPVILQESHQEVHNEASSRYEMFGPLVFRNYNGWNTGISVVNIAEQTNDVDITFYGTGGGAAIFQDSLTISPKGQDFVYIPNDPELHGSDGFVGSVMLSSDKPFHASIDQIKYGTGEAMSYIATAAGAEVNPNEVGYQQSLSLPLVQKGSPMTGLGDTTGIQLFNTDPNHSVQVAIEFRNAAGNLSQPTSNAPMTMTLQPYQNMTLYTMSFSGMLSGFTGSAVITPISGEGRVVGVSNNVNYDVQGDGAVAFNMVNSLGQFRFPQSQTQVDAANIELEPAEADVQVGTDHTLTATVYDQFGQPLPGAYVNFDVDGGDPDPSTGSAYTNVDGEVTFTYTNSEATDSEDIETWDVVTAYIHGTNIADTALVNWNEVPPTLDVDASNLSGSQQGDSGEVSASITNPVTDDGGVTYDNVRFEITVDGPEACGVADDWGDWFNITHVNYSPGDDGINGTFECDDGVFVGQWGPATGFLMEDGYSEQTIFTVETFLPNGIGTPPGIYTITVDLYEVDPIEEEMLGDPIASGSDDFFILEAEEEDDSDDSEEGENG
jgi:hypothetical protein